MRLLLTSNFPRPGNEAPRSVLKAWGVDRAFEWIGLDASYYAACERDFTTYGARLERGPAPESLGTSLYPQICLYLSGGPPLQFFNALTAATDAASIAGSMRATDALVLAASGGSMLCSSNLSVFRLQAIGVREAVRRRDEFPGLGLCDIEVLPHFDLHPAALIDDVRRYSEAVPNDVWCLPDGTAIACADGRVTTVGPARCLRGGEFVV